MRFRNLANMFCGYALAWGLFGMAALILNKSILTDSDPMTPGEVVAYAVGTFVVSTGALCVLARPSVTLDSHETLTVRNPLRVYRCDFAAVESLTSGFWGFPKLTVAGRAIRIMGMEESNLQLMSGGSDDMAVLRAELADRQGGDIRAVGREACRSRWALLDRGLVLLWGAWALYAISFFVL